jgi:glycosyltransferase involved in cell wall biosynthesis
MFSLAHNPAASVALYKFCQDKCIKMIGHHHDFYWEREFYNNPTNNFIKKISDEYFPPKDITHIVINSLAQEELKRKKGVDSYIIPNVFDFNQKQWELDDYNIKVYDKLGISPNDLIFLQATRIVRRKAIELAIDTISEVKKDLNEFTGQETYNGKKITKNTNIFLLLPGLSEESDYVEELKEYATQKDVELKLAFSISDDIRHEEEEIFSLWDFYAIADFITYPSILEGFGNQFLEAIFSKTPVLLFEYPVYKKDIAPLGFEVVTLGSKAEYERGKYRVNQNEIIKAKDKIFDILFNKEKASNVVQKNFELGKKYFSYETLEKKLKQILLEKNVI